MTAESEETQEQRLWRLEPGEKDAPSYMLSIKSSLPDMGKRYGRVVLGLIVDAEIRTVLLNNVIGMKAEVGLMQRRMQIAKDVPDYQRLVAEATIEPDEETASIKRQQADAIADAMIVAVDDAPMERQP